MQNVNKQTVRQDMAGAWALLVAWVLVWRGRIGKAWGALRGRDVAPEGAYIRRSVVQDIDGEVLIAPAVLVERVGIIRAIILQKCYEWSEYNRQKNSRRHYTAGRWWMYLSYTAWRDNHLTWVSVTTVRTHIKALVDEGLLLTIDAGEITAETWYAVNEAAVRALLVGGNGCDASSKNETSPSKNKTTPIENLGGGVGILHPTNSKQGVKQALKASEKQNIAGVRVGDAQTGATGASVEGVVVDYKMTGEGEKFSMPASPFAKVANTPPLPPPRDGRGNIVDVGLGADVLRGLIEAHGAERVREVCEAVPDDAKNPAGWVVSACRNGWDVTGASGATDTPDYSGGKYADFIES